MKISLPFFLALSIPVALFGQNVVLTNEAVNVFYENIDNPVSVMVENNRNIIVETDNGKIIQYSPGKYTLQDAKPGIANITVKKKTGSKVTIVGVKKFRVRELPLPVPGIAGKTGGKIPLNVLKAQIGIIATLNGFDFDTRFMVSRFEVTIFRNKTAIITHQNAGNRFDDAIKTAFQKLATGDVIIFDNIYCISPDKKERHLESIEFTIIP